MLSFMVVICWFAIRIYKEVRASQSFVLSKSENLESLLIDIRDGTKTFLKERRKYPRVKECVVAKIEGDNSDEFIRVINIGYEGALLRSSREFKIDDMISLNIYLPLHSQPINVKSKVTRVNVVPASKEQWSRFDVVVEFKDISAYNRDLLIDTVDVLKASNSRT